MGYLDPKVRSVITPYEQLPFAHPLQKMKEMKSYRESWENNKDPSKDWGILVHANVHALLLLMHSI